MAKYRCRGYNAAVPKPADATALIAAAAGLRDAVNRLSFLPPVECVYNPLDYAWAAHEQFLNLYGGGARRIVFLGMNPGPFGMAQVGVPFGEVAAVRDWLRIDAPIGKPAHEHPKRPVLGLDCPRSEVSGRRFWGFFAEKFGQPKAFFADHFVVNYCPLAFLESTGRNRTPDKLPDVETQPLEEICNAHLVKVVEILQPEWVVAVGGFAEKKAREVFGQADINIGRILHPSPASPAANRGWPGQAEKQLMEQGIWR
ncbi:MAG TPA: single-stranded DNA-binding protein [Verrucomicrobiota bacterium]|nr:single-stranded DNA-binding protein [Verrucomicrobiota bacterium]